MVGILLLTYFWELLYKKMKNIISKKTLREFWKKYPDTKGALEAWHAEAKAAKWKSPANIKAQYGNASILKGNRVVFNICGNKYRLIVKINYEHDVIRIRFVGTHKEYDSVNAEKI